MKRLHHAIMEAGSRHERVLQPTRSTWALQHTSKNSTSSHSPLRHAWYALLSLAEQLPQLSLLVGRATKAKATLHTPTHTLGETWTPYRQAAG
jgi:hypothetical protein